MHTLSCSQTKDHGHWSGSETSTHASWPAGSTRSWHGSLPVVLFLDCWHLFLVCTEQTEGGSACWQSLALSWRQYTSFSFIVVSWKWRWILRLPSPSFWEKRSPSPLVTCGELHSPPPSWKSVEGNFWWWHLSFDSVFSTRVYMTSFYIVKGGGRACNFLFWPWWRTILSHVL